MANTSKNTFLIWAVIVAIGAMGAYALLRSTSNSKAPTNPQTGQGLGFFKKESNTPLVVEGKPYFLYVGAQFCPSCAAERWSIVKALSRFGTWSGLSFDVIEEYGGISNIPTYNLVGAKYESEYLSLGHKEVADKSGRPITGQELTDFERKLFNQYDSRGSVPFLFLGTQNGQYVQLVAGYSPALIAGKTPEQIKNDLESNASVAHISAINEEADILTAYLCKATSNQPSAVCANIFIAPLVADIP